MESCKKLIASCFVGRGRSTIAVFLALLIAFGLIAPPPAVAQIGAIAVTAAAAAVVSLITNTIGALLGTANGLLGSINGFVQALANLWQNVVYPINLINQALAMVNQLIAQFRGLVAAIDNISVRSATLAKSDFAGSDHAEPVHLGFCAIRSGFQDDVPASAPGIRPPSRRPPASGYERCAGHGYA